MTLKFVGMGAAIALLLGAGSALADGETVAMAEKSSETSASWRGLHIYGTLGYGWSDSSHSVSIDEDGDGDIDFAGKEGFEASGFIGSIGTGYDIDLGNRFVLGAFGDYTFGDLDDHYNLLGVDVNASLEDNWAIGARLGYIIHKDTLLYGTAGYTSADLKLRNSAGSATEQLDGFFVGVGLERLIHRNLYLKAEYRYSSFDDLSEFTVVEGDATGDTCGAIGEDCAIRSKIDNDMHSLRIGLAYKFGADREAPPPPLK